MTYAVDFERRYEIGDYLYYLRRLDQHVSAVRRLLKGSKPDPTMSEEAVRVEDLPKQLKTPYRILVQGDVPSVA
jgi:hypothetical protein